MTISYCKYCPRIPENGKLCEKHNTSYVSEDGHNKRTSTGNKAGKRLADKMKADGIDHYFDETKLLINALEQGDLLSVEDAIDLLDDHYVHFLIKKNTEFQQAILLASANNSDPKGDFHRHILLPWLELIVFYFPYVAKQLKATDLLATDDWNAFTGSIYRALNSKAGVIQKPAAFVKHLTLFEVYFLYLNNAHSVQNIGNINHCFYYKLDSSKSDNKTKIKMNLLLALDCFYSFSENNTSIACIRDIWFKYIEDVMPNVWRNLALLKQASFQNWHHCSEAICHHLKIKYDGDMDARLLLLLLIVIERWFNFEQYLDIQTHAIDHIAVITKSTDSFLRVTFNLTCSTESCCVLNQFQYFLDLNSCFLVPLNSTNQDIFSSLDKIEGVI
jgi:hypothetical protein